MTRSLMCVFAAVAVAMGVGSGATAWANGPKGKGHPTVQRLAVVQSVQVGTHLSVSRGVRFSQGVYFRGSDCGQFRARCWSNSYRCWMFFDPITNCWYYWSAANGCFLPMNYALTVAPNGVPPLGTNTLPNQTPPTQTPLPGQLPPDQTPPNQVPPPQ